MRDMGVPPGASERTTPDFQLSGREIEDSCAPPQVPILQGVGAARGVARTGWSEDRPERPYNALQPVAERLDRQGPSGNMPRFVGRRPPKSARLTGDIRCSNGYSARSSRPPHASSSSPPWRVPIPPSARRAARARCTPGPQATAEVTPGRGPRPSTVARAPGAVRPALRRARSCSVWVCGSPPPSPHATHVALPRRRRPRSSARARRRPCAAAPASRCRPPAASR